MASSRSSSNPSSAFDLLAEPVRRWIWDQGWTELRDIQERKDRTLLKGNRDLIIAAPTAGGKTEAAFLPLISSVLAAPGAGGFDLVYVAPLRALINDQLGRMEDLCARAGLPIYPWHGDISQGVKSRARRDPRGVLLITPESLEALFVLRGLEVPTMFSGARAIIIDELHALLDSERGIHLRSLLTRLELAVGRRIRRVGLSATLTEMDMVKEYVRPEDPNAVDLLESAMDGGEVRVQVRGYRTGAEEDGGESSKKEVAKHLFARLRGTPNLVFAGSRENVEWYADALRQMSEEAKVPVDFLPHHASLSREHRLDVERRLKTSRTATAICTSTLELGIDIGDIDCVSQIGPPFSVSSLRQRLGRSGRRGQPAVLRMYAIERATSADSHPIDRLHLDLVRSVAMVELLKERWYEPPAPQALHLSTLTHQILSTIAEHGGTTAKQLHETLCRQGPFRRVSTSQFTRLLRQIASAEVGLIEQAPDGNLLLGSLGEKLVEHYSFYAVFQTSEDYRVLLGSKQIGVLPAARVFVPDMTIILSGRRWRILAVHSRDKVIEVAPDQVGRPPPFGGGGGLVHDRVVEKMKTVFSDSGWPAYLDRTAGQLLEDARSEFYRLGLDRQSVCDTGDRGCLLSTWAGTIKTSTLSLKLKSMGFKTVAHDGFLEVEDPASGQSVATALGTIAKQTPDDVAAQSLSGLETVMSERFHRYLSPDLLHEDATSSVVDLRALPQLASSIVGQSARNGHS